MRRIGLTARTRWAAALIRRMKRYVDARSIAPDVPGWIRTPQGMVPISSVGTSASALRRWPFEVYQGSNTQGEKRVYVTPGRVLVWSTGSGNNDGVPVWLTPTIDQLSLSSENGLPLQAGTWIMYFEVTISRSEDSTNAGSSYQDSGTDTLAINRVRHRVTGMDIKQDETFPLDEAADASPLIGWKKTYLRLADYTYDVDDDTFIVTPWAEGNFTYIIGDQLYDGNNPP